MKCHLCNIDLMENLYSAWNVGERNLTQYICKNKDCVLPATLKIHVNVILPSKQIVDYFLCLQIKKEWYGIASYLEHPVTTLFKTEIGISFMEASLLTVKRFYPLVWKEPLGPQLNTIFDRLQTLLLFS